MQGLLDRYPATRKLGQGKVLERRHLCQEEENATSKKILIEGKIDILVKIHQLKILPDESLEQETINLIVLDTAQLALSHILEEEKKPVEKHLPDQGRAEGLVGIIVARR